ncbi:MAG: AAA family ATPase [Methylobacter sp.]|nr:AAA family ATPase [Methylobacter sp.]MDP2099104.1 AAA family ATPase [Methylobacter sp.]MDP2426648.1 AAA family ATPase [Methylobacter sp.]MDP3056619.1 AAA family ATPase [Methylobacter sp.]MDP3364006.1 AAA family ATPase [Methylobacter sp.]
MLNSLEIKNFRALEDFKVAKLGRVNLIVGKNNSGKSTVLEALRIYAGNAYPKLLESIAASHDEKYKPEFTILDEPDTSIVPFEDLFTGRQLPDDETEIIIGESTSSDQALHLCHRFNVEHVADAKGIIHLSKSDNYVTKSSFINWANKQSSDDYGRIREVLLVKKNNRSFPIYLNSRVIELTSLNISFFSKKFGATKCSFIPTQLVSIDELAQEWSNIVGTEYEDVAKQALRIILPEFQEIYFVPNTSSANESKHIAKVKLPNLPRPVPLKSLGDGMIRILQLALKLVSAQGGFLLIDELENGLHYSIQEKIWAWLFEVSERLDIQVFATTHSWDCIENFTKVAIANETIEGVLFRMGKSAKTSNRGQIIATVFDKDSLYRMTQADIEIR